MAEYIERIELLKELTKDRDDLQKMGITGMALAAIKRAIRKTEEIPAADVRPERHGEWLVSGECYECSECGGGSIVNTNPYCWKCGAKMD